MVGIISFFSSRHSRDNVIIQDVRQVSKSKVSFFILSPSAGEASHNRLVRQSELYPIIIQAYIAPLSFATCLASSRLHNCVCSLNPPASQSEVRHDQICHWHYHQNLTQAGFELSQWVATEYFLPYLILEYISSACSMMNFAIIYHLFFCATVNLIW